MRGCVHVGALAFRDGVLVVNEALCVGCGTCATVCPTCAIEARHPADAQLLAAARHALDGVVDESAMVTFACHRAIAEAPGACAAAGAIELVCLSRMEESLVMSLFADGAQRVRLLHGECAGCPRENGFASIELVRQTMEKLIEAWGLTCVYDVEQVAAEQDSAAGCAGLPQVVAVDGEQPLRARPAVRPAHVQADGTLPHFVPLRRHALLDALADLGGKPATVELDTRLWGHITIDMGKCRSCKMCAVFCPTGALQKYVAKVATAAWNITLPNACIAGCARTFARLAPSSARRACPPMCWPAAKRSAIPCPIPLGPPAPTKSCAK